MARIEKPEVGMKCWRADGQQVRIYALDGKKPYTIHGARILGGGWFSDQFVSDIPLYDSDPTAPEPQAIDIVGRKWKTRDGDKVTGLRESNGMLHGEVSGRGHCWLLSGRKNAHADDHYDLVPDDAPEPLPALDLTKPVKTKYDEYRPKEVAHHMDGTIRYRMSDGVDHFVTQSGLAANGIQALIQCVRRDWTQADVPFPRPTFRIVSRDATNTTYEPSWVSVSGIKMSIGCFVSWPELARDWEYTVDGKVWLKPEAYE